MAATPPMLELDNNENYFSSNNTTDHKLITHEIFSILENNFLFGHTPNNNHQSSPAGKVRILSIDAAGDGGLLAAHTLLHLQTILRRKSGNPNAHISDFFDVVAGSGAGGVLAGLLFTRGKDGGPISTADESLNFISRRRKSQSPFGSVFRRNSPSLKKAFGDSTLKDTIKSVLIPCYDLTTRSPFLFSRADALEMDGCDFSLSSVCKATLADRKAVELRSIEGKTQMTAAGGEVSTSNPTAAAITHVLNNKQEFPLSKTVEDLLVLSLGNDAVSSATSFLKIAARGAADVVDEAVSMAFGESRNSSYVRIQGDGMSLGEKNVESVLFKGKRLVDYTNMEKLEMFAGELIKEDERRKYKCILPNVVLKNSNYNSPRRSSSATTLSTLSSC